MQGVSQLIVIVRHETSKHQSIEGFHKGTITRTMNRWVALSMVPLGSSVLVLSLVVVALVAVDGPAQRFLHINIFAPDCRSIKILVSLRDPTGSG